MKKRLFNFLALAAAALLSLPTQAAEVTDDYGVITSPADGTHKVYKRAGKAIYYKSWDYATADQTGRVEIVECEDGTVYVKDIISRYEGGSWIKGTKVGNTISIAPGQVVAVEEDDWGYTYTYKLAWGTGEEDFFGDMDYSIDNSTTNITFTVDGDKITLNGTSEEKFIGIFYSSSSNWNLETADYNTVWTLDADYQPASTDLVEAPADLEAATWFATGAAGSSAFKRNVTVGFDGSDVYIQGLFSDFPEAWVKGTISGTTATFKAMQYLGQKSSKDCWFAGADLADVTMTYDADKQKLTADGTVYATNSEDQISAVATYTGVVLLGEEEKIDELPYSNALATASDFMQFSVIDANSDGTTWNYSSYNNVVRYNYDWDNDGDDWLVSPAIKLEAGKLYEFAIDVRATSSTEKMEVKLATEATATALSAGIEVLGTTSVESDYDYATYKNETVTVSTTGYYYFGIHAISDAYSSNLYVKNFSVKAGAEATAPDAVTDLTVQQAEGELVVNISFKAPAKKLDGTDLTENLTKIEVLRDETLIKTFVDVAPGTALSYKDDAENLTYGSHTYKVLPYDANGAGKKSEADVFVQGVPVAVPAGLTTNSWNVKYNNGSNNVTTTATIGFDGSDVYVQGLFTMFPEAWIKGTVSGTTATFESGQFLGVSNNNNIWMTGTDSDEEDFKDFTMTYDAEANKLTSQNLLLANSGLEEINYISYLKNIVIQEGEFEEVAATTAANVDELPYSNALSTEALFNDFGTINVNEDNYYWKFNSSNSAAYYSNGYDVEADDWFVSPAIQLVAGKTYHFAIDARKGGYYAPEMEVKIATEPKASKLATGTVVIASTEISSSSFSTYENAELTVSTTGYYHFGIHVSTDESSTIYLKNFLVEAGIETTAPAAVTDLAVAQDGENIAAIVTFTAPAKDVAGNDLTENLTQVEILRDEAVIKTYTDVTLGTSISYTDNAADLTIGKHKYQVVAYNESGAGPISEEKEVMITGTATVPYTADLTDKSTFDLFTVIDGNEDENTWSWNSSTNGTRLEYDYYTTSNDYLVTMPIQLVAGKNYKVTVTARVSYDQEETFEVLVGNSATVEGLTQTVIDGKTIDNYSFDDFTGTFSVAEDGKYYVAVHAITQAYGDGEYLYVKTLAIEETAPTTIAVGIEKAGYATFSSTYALDFSEVTAIKAYTAAVDDEGNITFTAIEKVPANTGVLLVNPEAKESVAAINVPVIDNEDADEVEGNALVAVSTTIESLPTEDANGKNYILNSGSQGVGFYRAAGQSVAAGKAYLRLSAAEARSFIGFNFDNTTTGVRAIGFTPMDASVYDLQGRKMERTSQLKQGIYIISNKKVSVK